MKAKLMALMALPVLAQADVIQCKGDVSITIETDNSVVKSIVLEQKADAISFDMSAGVTNVDPGMISVMMDKTPTQPALLLEISGPVAFGMLAGKDVSLQCE